MMEYTDDEQTMPPDTRASTPSKGGFETLARQYGLDDMDLGGPTAQSSNQSVDDEFNSYANGILSPLGTDILKFWEVRSLFHNVHTVELTEGLLEL